MNRWLATFLATALASASILVAVWGVWLIVGAPEKIHYEWALPALISAALGMVVATLLWRHGNE